MALLGRNGMGKTTLAARAAGPGPGAEGTARFAGTDISSCRPK